MNLVSPTGQTLAQRFVVSYHLVRDLLMINAVYGKIMSDFWNQELQRDVRFFFRFTDIYLEVARDTNVPRDQLFDRAITRMQAQGTILQSNSQLEVKPGKTTQAGAPASPAAEISGTKDKTTDFVPQNPLR